MIAQPGFPRDIAYSGQEVAVVAAETIDIADPGPGPDRGGVRRAPAALTPREAMKPTPRACRSWTSSGPREGTCSSRSTCASAATSTADSPRRTWSARATSRCRRSTTSTSRPAAASRSGMAERLTVHEASQGVWNVKRELAKSLGLQEDQVRVVVQSMGGGFGSKAGAQRVVHYAARLAMLARPAGAPQLTRPEEFMSHPRRYAGEVTMRLGAKRDGTLTALDAEIVLDIGSGSLYAGRYTMTLHQISELYRCPNVRVRIVAVYTNTGPTGPQRGCWIRSPPSPPRPPSTTWPRASAWTRSRCGLRTTRRTSRASTTPRRPCPTPPSTSTSASPRWRRRSAGEPRPQAHGLEGAGAARRGHRRLLHRARRLRPFSAKADVVARPDGTVEVQAGVVEIGGGPDHGAADDRGGGAGAAGGADQHPPRRHRRHPLRAVEPRLAHHQRGRPRCCRPPPRCASAFASSSRAPRGLAPRPGGPAGASTCAARPSAA